MTSLLPFSFCNSSFPFPFPLENVSFISPFTLALIGYWVWVDNNNLKCGVSYSEERKRVFTTPCQSNLHQASIRIKIKILSELRLLVSGNPPGRESAIIQFLPVTSIEAWLCTVASTFVAVHRYTPTFCTCAFWMVNADVGPGSRLFTVWNSDWPERWNSHDIAGVGKPIAALQRSTCLEPFWTSAFLGGAVIWEATAMKTQPKIHSQKRILLWHYGRLDRTIISTRKETVVEITVSPLRLH